MTFTHDELIIRKKDASKIMCSECKKLVRLKYSYISHGKRLCYQCRTKTESMKAGMRIKGTNIIKIEDALNKTYEVKTYNHKDSFVNIIQLPQCFLGKKVKLILVEEEK